MAAARASSSSGAPASARAAADGGGGDCGSAAAGSRGAGAGTGAATGSGAGAGAGVGGSTGCSGAGAGSTTPTRAADSRQTTGSVEGGGQRVGGQQAPGLPLYTITHVCFPPQPSQQPPAQLTPVPAGLRVGFAGAGAEAGAAGGGGQLKQAALGAARARRAAKRGAPGRVALAAARDLPLPLGRSRRAAGCAGRRCVGDQCWVRKVARWGAGAQGARAAAGSNSLRT